MYTAYRVEAPIAIDGRLSDPAWGLAPRSHSFTDMATGRAVLYDTVSAVLWDDQCLYVGFWIEEPYPRAALTERDSIIFTENRMVQGAWCWSPHGLYDTHMPEKFTEVVFSSNVVA